MSAKNYIFTVLALLFVSPLIGVLAGVFSGFVVSLFFDETIREGFKLFGVDMGNYTLWQMGGFLGFVGSFIRPTVTKN